MGPIGKGQMACEAKVVRATGGVGGTMDLGASSAGVTLDLVTFVSNFVVFSAEAATVFVDFLAAALAGALGAADASAVDFWVRVFLAGAAGAAVLAVAMVGSSFIGQAVRAAA